MLYKIYAVFHLSNVTYSLRHWLFVQLHGFLGLIPLASMTVRVGGGLAACGTMVPGVT